MTNGSRGLSLLAVSTLLVTIATACGDDTGEEPTASPNPSAATSTSPSDSPTATTSPSVSDSPTDSGDPVPSPVITKAVRKAIADGFPALIPAGLPAGWTAVSAAYSPKQGGSWRIELTDDTGGAVRLVQMAQELEPFVSDQLGSGMQESGSVDLGEYGTGKWTVYSDGSTTAIAAHIAHTSALVSGRDQDTVVGLAELLLTAEDAGGGTGDG